ncbi:MAG: secretin N-terminal domain-containing protein [Deltaproteobacteria bacterium]
MKKTFSILMCTAAAALAALPVSAEQLPDMKPGQVAMAPVMSPPPQMQPVTGGMDGRISLDLRNIDIVDALKFLAVKAGLNIITTRAVTGRVTLLVSNASIKDVFDIMLRSNNLAFDRKGDIYNVMSQEEYKALYGKSYSDVRSVKVFYLTYAVPEQAFSLLDMLKSEIGRVMVDSESGNVLVMDSPQRLEMMEAVLKDFQEKNTVKVIKLNYAKAKDIEEALKTQLDAKKVGLIKADEKGNQIIVQTLPDRMDQIEKLIEDLDTKTREVLVDVNIVTVNLSNKNDAGIQWEGLGGLLVNNSGLSYLGSTPFTSVQASTDAWRSRLTTYNANGLGSYPFSGTTTNYSGSTASTGLSELHWGVVNRKYDFDVIFKYLETVGKTKILSNPKLAVVNNQEAKIHVGQKDAYVTTTTTTGQTTNTVSEQVTFVDVGVIISVVPIINEDGYVTLKIKTEINSVIDTLITPTNNKIPIIDTSLAETTVMVKEGSTIIIGGLKKDTEIENKSQTPFLGDIPVLGALFRTTSKTKARQELLIIMTPRVITGDTLVGTEGKEVGVEVIKPSRKYPPETQQPQEEVSKPVFVPATEEEQTMNLKGFK